MLIPVGLSFLVKVAVFVVNESLRFQQDENVLHLSSFVLFWLILSNQNFNNSALDFFFYFGTALEIGP